jgi:hypothetical protein
MRGTLLLGFAWEEVVACLANGFTLFQLVLLGNPAIRSRHERASSPEIDGHSI